MQTCYRHPGRETGVSCSNCERPICPDCMTTTSVGMRCPECSKQTTKVRAGAASFGRSTSATATYILIGLNVVAFLGEIVGGVGGLDGGGRVINDFGLQGTGIADGEWYRIITGGFLHAGPIHLLFNMFALYMLGSMLEPSIGTVRFVALYCASLLAGAFGALMLTEEFRVTVGASGAIFGLFAAAFVIARGRRLDEIASQLGFLLLINLAITFGIPGISIGGHLGGAAGGAICALAILAGDRGTLGANRVRAEVAVMVVIAVASTVGALVVA